MGGGGDCNQSNNCPLCQLLRWVNFKLALNAPPPCLFLSLPLCPALSKDKRQVKGYKLILLKNPKIFLKKTSKSMRDGCSESAKLTQKPPNLPGLPSSPALTSLSHPSHIPLTSCTLWIHLPEQILSAESHRVWRAAARGWKKRQGVTPLNWWLRDCLFAVARADCRVCSIQHLMASFSHIKKKNCRRN